MNNLQSGTELWRDDPAVLHDALLEELQKMDAEISDISIAYSLPLDNCEVEILFADKSKRRDLILIGAEIIDDADVEDLATILYSSYEMQVA